MNTLTIPFPSSEAKQVVVDMGDIVTVQQSTSTSSTIFISSGSVVLTHSAAANGALGNAINRTILNSNGGAAVVVMPVGVEVTAVTYN